MLYICLFISSEISFLYYPLQMLFTKKAKIARSLGQNWQNCFHVIDGFNDKKIYFLNFYGQVKNFFINAYVIGQFPVCLAETYHVSSTIVFKAILTRKKKHCHVQYFVLKLKTFYLYTVKNEHMKKINPAYYVLFYSMFAFNIECKTLQ